MRSIRRFGNALLIMLLAAVLLGVLQFFWKDGGKLLWLDCSVLQSPASKAFTWLDESISSWRNAPKLVQQNLSLIEANSKLQAECARLKVVAAENKDMQKLLRLRDHTYHGGVAATVLAHDPQMWYEQVIVDKGRAEGVNENMVAVCAAGLVGKVGEVQAHSSLVRLLTDERVVVPVRLAKCRATGVVYGQNTKLCLGRYFHHGAKIADQEEIFTSGLGDIFPKGILVGYADSNATSHDALFQEITVRLAIEPGRLEHVLLVQKR